MEVVPTACHAIPRVEIDLTLGVVKPAATSDPACVHRPVTRTPDIPEPAADHVLPSYAATSDVATPSTVVKLPPTMSFPWYSAKAYTWLFVTPSVSHVAPSNRRIANVAKSVWTPATMSSFHLPSASTNAFSGDGRASNFVPSQVTSDATSAPAMPLVRSTSFPCHSTNAAATPLAAGVMNPCHAASSGRELVTKGAAPGPAARDMGAPRSVRGSPQSGSNPCPGTSFAPSPDHARTAGTSPTDNTGSRRASIRRRGTIQASGAGGRHEMWVRGDGGLR